SRLHPRGAAPRGATKASTGTLTRPDSPLGYRLRPADPARYTPGVAPPGRGAGGRAATLCTARGTPHVDTRPGLDASPSPGRRRALRRVGAGGRAVPGRSAATPAAEAA